MVRIERLKPRDGSDDLGQAAGMEQLAVQPMRAAVIAQVEPEHGESALMEKFREREQVKRLGTAFPAMQQDRQAALSAAAAGGRLRELAHQANAVAAVEDERTARGHHRRCAPFDRAPAKRQARQNRLDVAVRKPARRAENHRSTMLISMRLLDWAAAFHCPAVACSMGG